MTYLSSDITQCYLPPDTARQASTRFTCPREMEGWVYLGVGYISRWFICLYIVPCMQEVH